MNAPERVELTLTNGPVVIQTHGSTGIDASYSLWNSICAAEFFPSGAERSGANYVITLAKSVHRAEEVRAVETELSQAFLKIAAAWVFSGGSHLQIETREEINSPRLTSNVNSLLERLLGKEGLTRVVAPSGMPIEIMATYSQPPLALATKIAGLMQADFLVCRLLNYYHRAWLERATASWPLSLYKVRDLPKKLYGATAAKKKLSIQRSEWEEFGKLLNNNDLRHAEIYNVTPAISQSDVEWLYRTARSWIAKFLRTKGVQAIG